MAPEHDDTTAGPAVPPEPADGEEARPALERLVLGDTPVYTGLEVAAETGVPFEQVRRLWRALGLPEPVEGESFSEADARAVSTLVGVIDSGAIDFDVALNLTRGVGQMMARLSDWQTSTLVQRVEEMEAGDDATGSRAGSAERLINELMDPFQELIVYAWRRHLAASITRLEAMGAIEEDLMTTEVTVGFADIVAFTALSNTIGQERIGDLVEVFEARCHDVVSRAGGRVIKSIGDSVLFTVEDATRGMEIAEGIINVIGRDPRMPDVRLGLASGSVVQRMGDVFGPPVNMAARLTAVARRNRIVIDAATAKLLPDDLFESRRMPARPVRGFGIVEPLTVRRR